MATKREEIIQGIAELGAGHRKLASLLREQAKLIPSEQQRKEASISRDKITEQLVKLGMVPEVDRQAVRESLDQPLGLETLVHQMTEYYAEQDKHASAPDGQPAASMGSVSNRADVAPSRRFPESPVRSTNRGPTYQSPYHC